jgi:hypothetical protein
MQKVLAAKAEFWPGYLAEDLRNVQSGGSGATTAVSDPVVLGGRRDITNGPTDFDIPPV